MTRPFKIHRLEVGDLKKMQSLVALLNEVFEEYHSVGSDKQLEKLLSNPDFHAIVAIEDDIIVGGVTVYEMARYYSDKSELYIYDIAVKTELQNKGIGKKLLDFLKAYGRENNIETIFVEALSDEDQAVKFYESTFGKREKVDHFNFEIKIDGA